MSDATADAPMTAETAQSRAVAIPASQVLITLVRREFWEHRALWMVPLVTAAVLMFFGFLSRNGLGFNNQIPDFGTEGMSSPQRHAVGVALAAAGQLLVAVPLYMAATVTLFFYLLSSLYDERKDRSILFWKSLPVSDAATVVSKLLVAMLIVPLGVLVVAIVTHLLSFGIWDVRHAMGLVGGPILAWDTVTWLKVLALMLTIVALAALWYAPIAGYLLLVSAWARRNPFLWAVLPPLILSVAERIALGSRQVSDFLTYRLGGVWYNLVHNVQTGAFNAPGMMRPGGKLVPFPPLFDILNMRALFGNPDLWIGVIIAAGLVYAAIRVRRYRDDT